MSSIASESLIDAVRDFNRFYTNWLGVLDRAYLASPYTLTEARALFEIGTRDTAAAVELVRELHLDPAYLSRILLGEPGRRKRQGKPQNRTKHRCQSTSHARKYCTLNRAGA